MNTLEQFYNVLFEPGEYTCYSLLAGLDDSRPNLKPERRLKPVHVETSKNFFVINPLFPNKDVAPPYNYDSALVGRRADCNIASFRNFLCDMDKVPLELQRQLLADVGMPYSTLVYSGGKSMHAIISLDISLSSERDYRKMFKRIVHRMGGKEVMDEQCINPSRFSRCPGAMRGDIEQSLIEVKCRISLGDLEAWLGPCPAELEDSDRPSFKGAPATWQQVLNPWCKTYLVVGSEPGQRNADAFKHACSMKRAGYDEDEIYQRIGAVADLDDSELRTTLNSAFATCDRDLNTDVAS